MTTLWLLLAFVAIIGALVLLDVIVWRKRPRVVKPREAWATYSLWLLSAAGFAALIFYAYEYDTLLEQELGHSIGEHKTEGGQLAALQFVACYVVEVALSIDNIAILALLIAFFKVPREALGRTVFWSLLLSLLVRLGCIVGCAWILREAHWFRYVLGGVLVASMVRVLLLPDESTDFNKRWFIRLVRRCVPICSTYDGGKLCIRDERGRWVATPIVLIVLTAGLLDVAFAVDSVPALFSITRDPLLAFTASALANLGLRSLYLTLAGVVGRFRYLRLTTVFVLFFLAVLMFVSLRTHAWTVAALAVVSGIMLVGIGASALHHAMTGDRRHITESPAESRPAPIEDLTEAATTARRNLRKVIILIIGTLIIIVVAPLVGLIPGPGGLIVAAAGLGLLATEFIWARKLLIQVKQKTEHAARKSEALARKTPLWAPPIAVVAFLGLVTAIAAVGPYQVFGRNVGTGLVLALASGPAVVIFYWAYKTVQHRIQLGRQRNRGVAASATLAAPPPKRA